MTATVAGTIGTSRIMLVGLDQKKILQRRLQAAGHYVVTAPDQTSAIELARHASLDATVLVLSNSVLNIIETIFNLKDVNKSMQTIILIDRAGSQSKRLVRRLREHLIPDAEILTRREFQKRLHSDGQQAHPAAVPKSS